MFHRIVNTAIEIDASAERVWDVLTDFGRYPEWNPFIRGISGTLAAGERLEVRFGGAGSRSVTFRPIVLSSEPQREVRWLGRFMLPRLFDGEHSFIIEPIGENRVRLVQRERFTGLLVPLLRRDLDTRTRRGFDRMNGALKERAERIGGRV